VHVRVELQPAAVGVQHAHCAGHGAELGVVAAEGGKGVPGALQQQRVGHPLMAPGQAAQFGRQREGEHEVGGRHQQLRLALEPGLGFVVLAVRAGAMAAGMGHASFIAAAGALRQHARRERRAAALHRRQGLPVAGQQPIPMTLQQRGFEALDQPGQCDHSTVPQVSAKRSISALMRVLH
jgi:hypothetical protein